MSADAQTDLTLEELLALARQGLEEAGLTAVPGDGRVSPVPDARTVRYYATLGLIDRPVLQGKGARYRRRHLLQLLAIKAMQVEGLRLEDIQRHLYGRSDRELTALVDAATSKPRHAPIRAPILLREVALEPGLKLIADERWTPGPQPDALVHKFRAAIAALARPGRAGDDA